MIKKSLFIASILLTAISFAQFEIGHTTITYNDAGRTGGYGSGGGAGRQIQTEIYYPADMAGDDVSCASGSFPTVVFGHGFVMAWDAYENVWEELVPQGYVIAFPRTEGGFSPDHEDFGLDLALVADRLSSENDSTASIFYQHLMSQNAIVGHSMGGGATILSAASNANVTTIVGLAPAETTPSAITAAANVTVPALIFSADEDQVTPAADHHTPIYNGLGSSCKYFINIIGGAHCYYANANFNCDFGESTSGGSISITRPEQHAIMFSYLTPWLDLHLKNDCTQESVFNTDLLTDTDVTYEESCTGFQSPNFNLDVTANNNTLSSEQTGTSYQWVDCDANFSMIANETNQSFTPVSTGNYAVVLGSGACTDTSDCYAVQLASLESTENKWMSVYPNPNHGILYVSTSENAEFNILDISGKIVSSGQLHPGVQELELKGSAGTYYLRISNPSKVYFHRLVKN